MQTLELGFYYHYKHDPNGDVGNYAYEIIALAMHTETKEKMMVYRTLYPNELSNWWIRPINMFMETVIKDGKEMPRFSKITDREVISKLEKIRDSMY